MKKTKTKKTKTSASIVAVILILFFSSCSSYKNGFIQLPHYSQSFIPVNFDSAQHKKEILNAESKQIASKAKIARNNKQVIPAATINRLFENLQNHYCIDSVYHRTMYFAKDDSVKKLARKKLVGSASYYHQIFQDDKSVRRLINRGDRAFQFEKKNLLHSQQFLWAGKNRKMLKYAIPNQHDRHSKCHFIGQRCTDKCNIMAYETVGFFSEIFGRFIGVFYKKPEPEKNISRLMPYLQKWDIIIEKSPQRLTDKFIPGYFGHAAIYVGDSLFVEGIQKGMVVSDPVHFAEGKSFLVIRLKELSEEKERRIGQLALGQIGKKYDFNYDVGYPDRLTCTELIYLVYDDFYWSPKKTAGIFTLCPDDIVRTAMKNEKCFFPLFFDEEQLIENPSPDFVKALMEKK